MKRKKFPPSQLKRENISLKSIEIAEISHSEKFYGKLQKRT